MPFVTILLQLIQNFYRSDNTIFKQFIPTVLAQKGELPTASKIIFSVYIQGADGQSLFAVEMAKIGKNRTNIHIKDFYYHVVSLSQQYDDKSALDLELSLDPAIEELTENTMLAWSAFTGNETTIPKASKFELSQLTWHSFPTPSS